VYVKDKIKRKRNTKKQKFEGGGNTIIREGHRK
jgi:hypothetical protein